jgi:hypothetical protein
MSETMNCPSCATVMEHDAEWNDLACPDCGLAAPAEVVKSIRELMVRAREVANAAQTSYVRGLLHGLDTAGKSIRNCVRHASHPATAVILTEVAKMLAAAHAELAGKIERGEHLAEPTAPAMTPERVAELEQDETAAQRALREELGRGG